MLGKLWKQEWRASWKVPTFLVILNLVCCLLAGLSFGLPIWDTDWPGLAISAVMMLFLFYFILIGSTIGITVYMAVRYYKSMYTDEGYLTHTLPVTARQLYLTKVLNMSAWSLISTLSVFAGGVIFAALLLFFAAGDEIDLVDTYRTIMQVLQEPEMEGWQLFGILMLLFLLVSCFSGTMMITGSVNIGQLIRKHRILGAIGVYFGIYTVIQIISMVVMVPVFFTMTIKAGEIESLSIFSVYNVIYGIMTLAFLVISVVLYFVSEYLIQKKLELE